MPPLHSSVELLEDRIAPAAFSVGGINGTYTGNTLHFTDQDGDLATVVFSKSFITAADLNSIFTFAPTGTGNDAQLQKIDLTAAPHPTTISGMSIAATAKRPLHGTGDGKVNIGYIDAVGLNLANVTVTGDLGRIDAGATPNESIYRPSGNAVNLLTLGNMGVLTNLLTLTDAGNSVASNISEGIGRVKVTGSIDGASLTTQGNMTSLTVTGNLDASSQAAISDAALIQIGGSMGAVVIDGSILGGSASNTGEITSLTGNIASLYVGGNIDGTAAANGPSGFILTGGGSIGKVTVHGSIMGGATGDSGTVFGINLGAVAITGNLQGGTAPFSGSLLAQNSIASVSVDNITSGATIRGSHTLGGVTVHGSITGSAAQPVIIAGEGLGGTAIASLSVTGSVTYADIMAGYSTNFHYNNSNPSAPYTDSVSAENPNAVLGAVTIGGNLVASNLIAGVMGGTNNGNFTFGTASDSLITGGSIANTSIAQIASVTIKGNVQGDSVSGAFYGIVSEQIGSVKVGTPAITEPLMTGASNDTFTASKEIVLASNVTIDEVPAA